MFYLVYVEYNRLIIINQAKKIIQNKMEIVKNKQMLSVDQDSGSLVKSIVILTSKIDSNIY